MSTLRHTLARMRLRRFGHLPMEAAFDEIYMKGIWSQSRDEPSGGGSYGAAATHYVDLMKAFITNNKIRSLLDIGCGDFNIGSQLAPCVDIYYACDVSAAIIQRNKSRFRQLNNVEFRQANACVDALPQADLITVRQVFQHLTNRQIEMALQNIESTAARFVLVTDQAAPRDITFTLRPNLDLPSHSSGTRMEIGSALDLSAPPFRRRIQLLADFESPHASSMSHERLNTCQLLPG